jgi:hypothetical protein
MDAAVAGILGALAGGLLGAGGAIGASVVATRGQSKGTHRHWLRTVRRDAYREFLTHAGQLLDILIAAEADLANRRLDDVESRLEAYDDEQLRRALALLQLEAPPEVIDEALRLLGSYRTALMNLRTEARNVGDPTYSIDQSALLRSDARVTWTAFKKAAQQDLQKF